jgi:hypothetical protein
MQHTKAAAGDHGLNGAGDAIVIQLHGAWENSVKWDPGSMFGCGASGWAEMHSCNG